MSFISFQFIVFMAVVTLLYYLVPKKYQWVLLLIASYGFFLYGGVTPLIFILSTTLTVYGGGRWMEHVKATAASKKAAKATNRRILTLITVFNFGILLMLKYYNFFAESVNHGLGVFAYDSQLPLINIVLPLGISFYTFQSIGYLIDVYRNKYAAEKSLPRFALFISYFPILVQGPISRYNDLGTQLREEHQFDYRTFKFGMQLALWGFFKKMVIADRIGTAVSTVFGDYAQFDGFQTGLAIILYALQIYLDFSGGIDIARGCSEMLGITLMENFQRPYFGNTVSEYWRRWHIALTSWMRDYVFFPLTLSKFSNKVGKWGRKHIKGSIGKQLPSYFPTFVTFFLIGVWHGAGWGFIVFGLYNATIIVVSMILTPVFQRMIKFFHINEKSFGWKVFQIARTFLIMAAGKTLTRASSVHDAEKGRGDQDGRLRGSFVSHGGSRRDPCVYRGSRAACLFRHGPGSWKLDRAVRDFRTVLHGQRSPGARDGDAGDTGGKAVLCPVDRVSPGLRGSCDPRGLRAGILGVRVRVQELLTTSCMRTRTAAQCRRLKINEKDFY